MYDDRGISSATYSSSEGGDGYSIYSDWNNTVIESNADMIHTNDTGDYSDIILPTPRIPTSSPPSSPAQPPSVNNKIHSVLTHLLPPISTLRTFYL